MRPFHWWQSASRRKPEPMVPRKDIDAIARCGFGSYSEAEDALQELLKTGEVNSWEYPRVFNYESIKGKWNYAIVHQPNRQPDAAAWDVL